MDDGEAVFQEIFHTGVTAQAARIVIPAIQGIDELYDTDAGTAWAYGLLGERFAGTDGHEVRNYTQPQTFDLPGHGRRRLYRVDFSDQHALSRDLTIPVRTYFGLDSRLATAALATLTWIPDGSRTPRGLHLPGSDRWLILARGHDGTTRHAHGHGQSHATAVITTAAVRAARRLPPGVHHLHQVLTLTDLPTGRETNY